VVRAWDQAMWFAVIVFSCFEPFFGSATGGAILPSRPHNGAADVRRN
jgi:hypothetical protein